METSPATFESPLHAGVLPDHDSPFHSECLSTALELLEVLREEAGIIRRFEGAELLRLVPRKEYLVRELEWKIQAARDAGEGFFPVSDSYRALLGEIDTLNTSNGVFIEKAISYWHDLFAVFSPQGYGPTGKKKRRQARSPRGLTFEREI
jgi:flagellar biosynthesis/type III secretory pathway chaperone